MTDQRPPGGEPRFDPEAAQPYPTPPGASPAGSAVPPGSDTTQPFRVPSPPHGFPSVDRGGPPPERRSNLPLAFLAGVLITLAVVGLLWVGFLGPRGTVDPQPSASQVAVASPSDGSSSPTASSASTPGSPPAGSGSPSVPVASPSTAATSGTPVASEVPSPGTTLPPSAEPGPSDTGGPVPTDLPIDPDIAARIEAVTRQVPPIRGLEELEEVPFRFIGEEQFTSEFRVLFGEENPPERLAAEEALLKRLGLLEPDADLEELILSLYGSQVAAFYDPRTGVFTVVQREGFQFGPDDEIVVAHEYDHALQDQHFDLEGTDITDPAEGDRALADLALIEGDATALMLDWAQTHLDFEALLEVLGSSLSPADQELLESMPPVLRRQIEFPYIDGFAFVTTLRAGGDWSAVDEAFRDRPVSTEQILHPEKYQAGEEPVAVGTPDLAPALGDGWRESSRQTMGELLIGVFVADGEEGPPAIPGLPAPLPNAEATAGWGGDRLVSLDGPDGAWAVVWVTAWDSDADADEFNDAALAAFEDLDASTYVRPTIIVEGVEHPVLIIVAHDDETMDLVERVVLESL